VVGAVQPSRGERAQPVNVIPIGNNAYLGTMLAGLWGIAVLLPNLAVAVRRLRDAGYG
jgi:uncharacterized membrane protein YhaH (DUF805 family)